SLLPPPLPPHSPPFPYTTLFRSSPQLISLYDRSQSPLGIRLQLLRVVEHIGISLNLRATDTASQLIELGQTELLGIVDDQRISIGKVDPVFNDRRRDQNIVFSFFKGHNAFFQVRSFELPMGHNDPQIGENALELVRHRINRLHSIVQEIHLPSPGNFPVNGFLDEDLAIASYFGNNRQPARWRRSNDRNVAQFI